MGKTDRLPYALDANGEWVYIEDIPDDKRGLACGCYCPKCKEPLVAKIGYGEKKPHFAHNKKSKCQGAYMTELHLFAEQIIEREKAVMAPSYKTISEKLFKFKDVEVEERVDRSDLQPDVVGITDDGIRLHIEIRNTSEIKDYKKAKIKESNISCLEIDVREQKLDKNKLKEFLLNSSASRQWINNPIYEEQIKESEKRTRQLYYGSKEIQEEKILKYNNDKRIKIITANDCVRCVHHYNGKCIYLKERLYNYQNDIEYIACNQEKRSKDIAEKHAR